MDAVLRTTRNYLVRLGYVPLLGLGLHPAATRFIPPPHPVGLGSLSCLSSFHACPIQWMWRASWNLRTHTNLSQAVAGIRFPIPWQEQKRKRKVHLVHPMEALVRISVRIRVHNPSKLVLPPWGDVGMSLPSCRTSRRV